MSAKKWSLPDRKVIAGGVGGVLGWGIATALEIYVGFVVSPELIAGILALVTAYLVPSSVQEILDKANAAMADGEISFDDVKGLVKW